MVIVMGVTVAVALAVIVICDPLSTERIVVPTGMPATLPNKCIPAVMPVVDPMPVTWALPLVVLPVKVFGYLNNVVPSHEKYPFVGSPNNSGVSCHMVMRVLLVNVAAAAMETCVPLDGSTWTAEPSTPMIIMREVSTPASLICTPHT